MRAVVISKPGGTEVIGVGDVPMPDAPTGDRVRRRSFDDRFHHRRQRIDFAEAGNPRVGLDTDQERVLAPIRLRDVHLRLAQDDGFHIGDLQALLPSPLLRIVSDGSVRQMPKTPLVPTTTFDC